MERKELDKYKMVCSERAKDSAYLLYEMWKRGDESLHIRKADVGFPRIDTLYTELKKVRTITVQMIAEETGRRYDLDMFTISIKGKEKDNETLNIYINRDVPYEIYDKDNPITKDTKLTEIKAYFTSSLFNSLRRCNFETIGDALLYTDAALKEFRVFGEKRIQELNEFYSEYGLR